MVLFPRGGPGLLVGAQPLSVTSGLCEICGSLDLIAFFVSTACCRACLFKIHWCIGWILLYCELTLAEPHPVAGLCVLIVLHGVGHLLL